MKATNFFFIIIFFCVGSFAQSLAKKVTFIENKYSQGDFKSVITFSQRLFQKLEVRQPINHAALIQAYGYYAASKYKMSYYEEFENKMTLAKGVLKNIPKDSINSKILSLYYLSNAFEQVGQYRKAQEYIDEANKLFYSRNQLPATLKFDLSLLTATIYTKRGYNLKADSILEVLNSNIQTLLAKEKTIQTSKGREKQVKISKSEAAINNQNYAKFLYLRSLVEFNKGNYKTTSNLSNSTINWVKKNIGKRNQYSSKSYLLLGNANIEQDLKQEAFASFKKAIKFTKGKDSNLNKLSGREKIISLYLEEEKDLKLRRNVKKLARATRYYPKSSVNKLRSRLPEISRLMFQNRYSKASKKLTTLLETKKLVLYPYDDQTAMLNELQAMNLVALNKGFQATDSIKKLIVIKNEIYGQDAPEFHQYLMKLASCYINYTNEFKAARNIYAKSFFDVIEKNFSNEHKNYVSHLQQIGLYYDLVDKYDSSLVFYQNAVDTQEKFLDIYNIKNVPVLEKLADIQLKKGDYEQANSTINHAIEVLNNNKKINNIEKVNTFETMSRLYNTLGKYKESDEALKTARKLSKKSKFIKDQPSAKTADDQAKLFIRSGNYAKAEELLKSTLEIKEKRLGISSREITSTLNELGNLYIIISKYNEAEKILNRALAIDDQIFGNASLKYAETLKLLEKLYLAIGDFKRAEEVAIQVVSIRTKLLGTKHLETANSTTDLAYVKFYNNGNRKEIDNLLNQSLQTLSSIVGSNHPLYAEVLKDMAILKIEANKLKLADSLLGQANLIWENKFGSNNVYSAEAQMLRGEISKREGDFTKSEKLYNAASRTYKGIFNEEHPNYVNTLSKLSQIYYIQGNYNKSLAQLDHTTKTYLSFTQTYFKSLSSREKSKFWNVIKEDFEFYNGLAVKLYDKNPKLTTTIFDNSLQTKGLLLSNSIRLKERILTSKNTALIDKFNEWNEKKELLAGLLSQSTDQVNSNGIDPKKLEKEIEQLEKSLGEGSEEFKNSLDDKKITWKDVKNSLKPNEYAVEVIRYRYYDKMFTDSIVYAALILSEKSTSPQLVIIGSGKKLETKMLKYYRNVMKSKVDDRLSYINFWQPIKAFIPNNSKIYFSAEGVYNQINIETLLNAETGKYVIDENEIVLLTSTKEVPLKRKYLTKVTQTANNVVIIGNPSFYAQIPDNASVQSLEGAEREVKTINDMLKTKNWNSSLYIGDKADKDLVKSMNSPKVFHVATHGYFKEDLEVTNTTLLNTDLVNDPLLRCGLLLKGAGDYIENTPNKQESGILTAYEAMNLNLDNTELVILSACETGAGEVQVGEGVFGLQRSFLVAGSEMVIMSLFKVSDEATEQLMQSFYKNWLETGNKRKAFADAKRSLITSYKSPIFWGSFIMIGMD